MGGPAANRHGSRAVGIGIFLGALAAFASYDAFCKQMLQSYPAPFINLMRYIAVSAIAVSVISSVDAVVPSRARSRRLAVDQDASRSAAPGSSSHGDSIPSVCDPCPGASKAITFLREHCEDGFVPCNRL